MAFLLVLAEDAPPTSPDDPAPKVGMLLKRYDPEWSGGMGAAWWTTDFREALQFADAGEALTCWRQQSKVRPLRFDGEPNRPLTALTIELRVLR